MKGYSFRSLTDLVLKIFKTKVNAGIGLSGGGSLEADRTLAVKYGTTAGTATQGNDSRLSDSREWTAATISKAEAEEGSATTRRAFTAQRVRQAIAAWWNSITGVFGRDLVTSVSNSVARDKLGLFTSALRWPTWAEVTGKPTTFTPNSHTHPWSQVTEQPVTATRWPSWGEVAGKPVVQTTGASTTNIMSQKSVTDALEEITRRLFPVGTCYTQYHGTPTPSVLFGGVWELMFADRGVFFRTEGGNAGPFNGTIQQDLFKAHNHAASTNTTGAHTHIVSGTAVSSGAHTHALSGTAASAGAHTHSVNGTASSAGGHEHTVSVTNTGGAETRPINVTIKVWKRVS